MNEKDMTARQYLGQAYRLDESINTKLRQLGQLKSMATHISSTISDIKVQTSHSTSRLEDTMVKIIDQEREIDSEIDELVDLKAEIRGMVDKVEDPDHRLILEKRYLVFEDWNQIADEMFYSIQHIFALHTEALRDFEEVLKAESK